MFYQKTDNLDNIVNNPVRQCYLGKVTKFLKCFNLGHSLIGYTFNRDQSYQSIYVDEYVNNQDKKPGVWWELHEVPCIVLSTQNVQYGVCIEQSDSYNTEYNLHSIGLHDIIKYIAMNNNKFIGRMFYDTIKCDTNGNGGRSLFTIIHPFKQPFFKYRRVNAGYEIIWDQIMIEPPCLFQYIELVTAINHSLVDSGNN